MLRWWILHLSGDTYWSYEVCFGKAIRQYVAVLYLLPPIEYAQTCCGGAKTLPRTVAHNEKIINSGESGEERRLCASRLCVALVAHHCFAQRLMLTRLILRLCWCTPCTRLRTEGTMLTRRRWSRAPPPSVFGTLQSDCALYPLQRCKTLQTASDATPSLAMAM